MGVHSATLLPCIGPRTALPAHLHVFPISRAICADYITRWLVYSAGIGEIKRSGVHDSPLLQRSGVMTPILNVSLIVGRYIYRCERTTLSQNRHIFGTIIIIPLRLFCKAIPG